MNGEAMKFDVCMWAKNGEKYLPRVLKRIDEVIPSEVMGEKIFVDDSSTDKSVEIAKDFNWNIYHNEKGWINGGTEVALKHVKTDLFISVEQDVVLTKNFMSLLKHFDDPKTAVACGVYYPTVKYGRMYFIHHINELRKGKVGFIAIGSNMYRTKYIRELGFVKDKIAMLDFYNRVNNSEYKWITDYDVVSDHIRESFWVDLQHFDRIYRTQKSKSFLDDKSLPRAVGMVMKSVVYLRCGNPIIPVLEAMVRFKFLELYLTTRRGMGKQS